MQWHQLDHMQTICTSLQTDRPNHTNTSSLNFYRPDVLPGAQQSQSTEGNHISKQKIEKNAFRSAPTGRYEQVDYNVIHWLLSSGARHANLTSLHGTAAYHSMPTSSIT